MVYVRGVTHNTHINHINQGNISFSVNTPGTWFNSLMPYIGSSDAN